MSIDKIEKYKNIQKIEHILEAMQNIKKTLCDLQPNEKHLHNTFYEIGRAHV